MDRIAGATKARTNCVDGNATNSRRFVVFHAFDADEPQHRALLLRQSHDSAVEIAEYERSELAWQRDCVRTIDFDTMPLPYPTAHKIDILVMHEGEEPSLQIGAGLPEMRFLQRAEDRVLD